MSRFVNRNISSANIRHCWGKYTPPRLSMGIGDRVIEVSVRPISLPRFEYHGFNPLKFNSGVKIIAMRQSDFSFYRTNQGAPNSIGMYCYQNCPEFAEAFAGTLEHLPKKARLIFLPHGSRSHVEAHEIMHDIYFSTFSARQRREWVNQISFLVKVAYNYPHANKNIAFFQEVAIIAEKLGDLRQISPHFCYGRETSDPSFHSFAAECFAYAGEAILYPENLEISPVPESLIGTFRFNRLFQRELLDSYERQRADFYR